MFTLPQSLWPVLPPGAFYVMEGGHDPRSSFTYLQHSTFPDIKVRVRLVRVCMCVCYAYV